MSVPGTLYVGHSLELKKVMVGIDQHSTLLSTRAALKLASHIRATVRRLDRSPNFDDGGSDESDI